jgi:hypothetical protein
MRHPLWVNNQWMHASFIPFPQDSTGVTPLKSLSVLTQGSLHRRSLLFLLIVRGNPLSIILLIGALECSSLYPIVFDGTVNDTDLFSGNVSYRM